MEDLSVESRINTFMLDVIDTSEYHSVEYLVFSIRKLFLDYMSASRLKQFEIPAFLDPLVDKVIDLFNQSGISTVDMLRYMLDNDVNSFIHYYASEFIIPVAQGHKNECVPDLNDLFAYVMTGYILDVFRETRINIGKIVQGEVLLHETNQYGLSIVNGVDFYGDYFVFEDKAYLYSMLTNTTPLQFGDSMPGFARLISNEVCDGNILLRLDERLALPKEQAISYSTLNFQKYHGPQFHFNRTSLKSPKTITVHMDEETSDKLLLVVKKDYDQVLDKPLWHIEIETLPHLNKDAEKGYKITTFLHGMYYPDDDLFTHIDCTRNQYDGKSYESKYTENAPVDLYTENNDLHHKIWCIEQGHYSRELWYKLMVVSLNERYCKLLDEILQ
ncbi:MAG: hypothetical protein IJM37_02625 [Lachnospiraceae bacterium]|nr:hypothetical protein [Lachnospiraceae bacterium]